MRREDGNVAGLQWWMPRIVRTFANSMLSMDEPGHKRLRDIVDEALRRRAVLEMEPHIQLMNYSRKVRPPISSSASRANCRCR
jgi:cytochrome P450 PksS